MNAKIAKTKQALLDALSRLLENSQLEDISVSQLCKEASINRTTFYKYYCVPLDVLTENVDGILDEILYRKDGPQKTLYEYMLSVCQTVYEHRKLMSIYMRSSGDLMQMFYKAIMRQSGHLQFLLEPTLNFVAGGVVSLLTTWMMRNYPEPPEAIARIMTDCAERLLSKN